ncbi:hypothetical protein FMEAI12_6260010 [Parafrankia sp. Ea1.12]|nr:hypothetical protein FMEAI12_6260010 [Parafrankia sp. Ea1.12]
MTHSATPMVNAFRGVTALGGWQGSGHAVRRGQCDLQDRRQIVWRGVAVSAQVVRFRQRYDDFADWYDA